MKGILRVTICFLSILLLISASGVTPAQERGAAKTRISVPIMKTSQIKPGMKGYGLTVFRGIKPERFEVEVIDVLKKAFPKHDLILIKCAHPVIEKAHIIAGMSGSPIYINNKLIGALAYGWGFTKEPIAGVTPIEWMLEEMDEPKPQEQGAADNAGFPLLSKNDAAQTSKSLEKGIRPLSLPLYLSGSAGLPDRFMNELNKKFSTMGLTLMQGAGGSAYSQKIGIKELVPGAPLGVSLMKGDIDLTGIGTLTHREGNRIIAFGHPMMLSGQEVAMPITTAFIHGVLPSQWTSFKFGSPSKAVGTLTQDRMPAIAGTLRRTCRMIPMHAEVYNPTNKRTQSVDVEMVYSRFWTPALASLVKSYLIELEGITDSNYVIDYVLTVEFENYEPLKLQGMMRAWWLFTGWKPYMVLSSLVDNPFEPLRPKRIDLKMKTVHKKIDARIQRAWFDQLEVQPGSEVKLHVQIHPFKDTQQEITFPIKIPPHLDEGKYDIVVAGGDDWAVQMPTPPAESVNDIFTQLKMQYLPTTLVAILELPTVGVGFRGQLFRQLPSSVFGTLVSSSSAGVSTFQDGIHFTHETPWYLTGGSQRLKIVVKQLAEE